jgi:DNA-binding MarR family transcriptional regulator
MSVPPVPLSGLGTRLRHLLELLDGDVAALYPAFGLDGHRPRFSPFLRALTELGPSTIRDLADAVGVTHSAASQTVGRMRQEGLVELRVGDDARERIVHATDRARELMPVLAAEWAAVEAAVRDLDAELPHPLREVVAAAERALARRPFRDRVADAARELPGPLRDRLGVRPGDGGATMEG